MSVHIAAKHGEIAETILLPGDPLRARFIAETYFENPVCYNEVRNMLGFTGIYKGKRISVQGTGMGIPSISIYANELFRDYGVKTAIRVGTAGSLQKDLALRDIVLAQATCTDSGANAIRFKGLSFAPTANWGLLYRAWEEARTLGLSTKVGPVISSDMFYTDDPNQWELWARWGVLAVEMESAELYTLAAKYGREALAILTISDSLVSGEATSSEERERSFAQMLELALTVASAN